MKALANLGIAVALALATGASAQPTPPPPPTTTPTLQMWRLDCGSIQFKDFGSFFSDTNELPRGPRTGTDSCYLIRNGAQYLLWDTGLPAALKGKPTAIGEGLTASIDRTIAEQLADLGLTPDSITMVGISHMHADHLGQVGSFPNAKLIIGKADFEGTVGARDPFGPWRVAAAKLQLAHGGDVDIFGDGSVIALNMPGHTPDHLSLLVKLAGGNVLLTGDLYHSTMARNTKQVPGFNTSRAETLASMDRFERLAKSYRAKVIIQHEPADIAKLPAFPDAAQ